MNCVGRKIPLLKQDDGVPLRAFANDRELSEVTIQLKSYFSIDLPIGNQHAEKLFQR